MAIHAATDIRLHRLPRYARNDGFRGRAHNKQYFSALDATSSRGGTANTVIARSVATWQSMQPRTSESIDCRATLAMTDFVGERTTNNTLPH